LKSLARFKLRPGLVLAGVLLAVSAHASAQVIEIDPDGGVKTYDGPAMIHADGSSAPLRGERPVRRPQRETGAPDGMGLATRAAAATDLSPELVEAVAWRESRFRPGVISPKGAVGEMQLMPATARALGVDPFDSQQNFRGGAIYLSGLMRRFNGNLVLALAAYNAGPGAVEKYGGVPPFKETRAYVADVLDRLSSHAAAVGAGTVRR